MFIFYRSTEQRRSEERQWREESRVKEEQLRYRELAGIYLLLIMEVQSNQGILGIYAEDLSRLETYPSTPTTDIWEQSKWRLVELVGLESPDTWIDLAVYNSAMQQFLTYTKARDLRLPEVQKKALQHIEIMKPRGERILLEIRSIFVANNMEESPDIASLEEDTGLHS